MALENSAGINVVNSYGPRDTDASKGGSVTAVGQRKFVEYNFSYDQLPESGETNIEFQIPAGSTVLQARWCEGSEEWAGGTSLAVEVVEKDGTNILDLWTALDPTTDSEKVEIDTKVGAEAGELHVTATGTFTAGTGTIIVEYFVPII